MSSHKTPHYYITKALTKLEGGLRFGTSGALGVCHAIISGQPNNEIISYIRNKYRTDTDDNGIPLSKMKRSDAARFLIVRHLRDIRDNAPKVGQLRCPITVYDVDNVVSKSQLECADIGLLASYIEQHPRILRTCMMGESAKERKKQMVDAIWTHLRSSRHLNLGDVMDIARENAVEDTIDDVLSARGADPAPLLLYTRESLISYVKKNGIDILDISKASDYDLAVAITQYHVITQTKGRTKMVDNMARKDADKYLMSSRVNIKSKEIESNPFSYLLYRHRGANA